MEKGVAIPYIVALVIGLIVIVIIVYLVYRFVIGGGGGSASVETCRARFMDWCTMCRNIGWSDGNKLTLPQNLIDECKDVIAKHLGFYIDVCTSADWCNKYCDNRKTKLDCCTVGVKNDECP
ncbi:MAG: hypothetical protein QXP77_00125 [Candidatus Aenigmatarchaeota archaeon]